MIESLRQWWNMRTLREKRLLLFAGGLLIIVLAWLLIVRPVDLALDEAKARHDRAVIARAQVESRIATIEALQNTSAPPRPAGSIADIVGAEAVRAGFNVSETDPVGTDGARIVIPAARPQAFFAWVADLEGRLGLDIVALTARPNADQTLSVDVTFRGGR